MLSTVKINNLALAMPDAHKFQGFWDRRNTRHYQIYAQKVNLVNIFINGGKFNIMNPQ